MADQFEEGGMRRLAVIDDFIEYKHYCTSIGPSRRQALLIFEVRDNKMRALRFRNYGKPSVLAIEETPVPQPGPGEVIVQVSAAEINRADVAAVAGAFKSTTPRTPGRGSAARAHMQNL
jgi:hypothetical protein